MKIYTSYYGNLKNIPKDIEPISISRTTPKEIKIFSIEELMPSYKILNDWKQSVQDDEAKKKYEKEYYKQLQTLDPDKVIKQIERLSLGNDAVLLCYEKSSDFCHRHLVAEWLKKYGYDVKEYSFCSK